MSLLLKHFLALNNRLPKRYKRLLSSLALSLCALNCWTQVAQAEGSRTLYPSSATASSSRANLEWRTNTYGNLVLRRTLLKGLPRNKLLNKNQKPTSYLLKYS
ncbi:hypothetical protein [Nostoc sp.]|uniref:hypothetical protein n=1 Tax=Nostoc sp. TaxID=1180 RepID=UPI002FF84616